MSAGAPDDRSSLDARLAYLATQTRDLALSWVRIKAWLDRQGANAAAQIVALSTTPWNYTTTEATNIVNAINDQSNLANINMGVIAGQAVVNNYQFASSKLTGLL